MAEPPSFDSPLPEPEPEVPRAAVDSNPGSAADADADADAADVDREVEYEQVGTDSESENQPALEPDRFAVGERPESKISRRALAACLISILVVLGSIWASGVFLPEAGPAPSELVSKTRAALATPAGQSFRFAGTLSVNTTNRFLSGSWVSKASGAVAPAGYRLELELPDNKIEIIVLRETRETFFRQADDKFWTALPAPETLGDALPETTAPGAVPTADSTDRESSSPSSSSVSDAPGLSLTNLSGYVAADSVDGQETWRFQPEIVSLFESREDNELAPLLSTLKANIWIERSRWLPTQVELDWKIASWMLAYFEKTKTESLKQIKNFISSADVYAKLTLTDWGKPVTIERPAPVRELGLGALGQIAEEAAGP